MTIQEHLHTYLTSNGLWPKEADAVMEAFKAQPEIKDVKLNDVVGDPLGYPKSMLAVLQLSVKRTAAEWLATNKPMHFARAMFDDDVAKELGIK